MEDNSGLKCILGKHCVYNLFQEIVGGNSARKKFISDYVKANAGDKIVEIGCGPAQLLPWLVNIRYIGIDTNKDYIDSAKKEYRSQGLFLLGDTKLYEDDTRVLDADIVICSAILHHLNDDEAVHAIKFAYKVLKKGGRLVCGEPCWVPNQGYISKWILSNDRGKNIRDEEGYKRIMRGIFKNSNISSIIDLKPLRIPSTSVIITCVK